MTILSYIISIMAGDDLVTQETRASVAMAGLILGWRPANERRRYFVTTSLIGWAQA